MLDNVSKYEVLKLNSGNERHDSILLLHKVTETGSPFVVVAGYFLNEVGRFEGSTLAEIETVPESEYSLLKEMIRRMKKDQSKKVPITFW